MLVFCKELHSFGLCVARARIAMYDMRLACFVARIMLAHSHAIQLGSVLAQLWLRDASGELTFQASGLLLKLLSHLYLSASECSLWRWTSVEAA